jgi:glycerol-3-phosphate dehydrogenase
MNHAAMDATQRDARITSLESERFDVMIIGAGITGCGIARETAMRGMTTLLVDAGDIGSGTSSRSSKLIHGGLRYLAQGQMSVVREAARERRTLRRIAPHLALTNPMVVLGRSSKSLGLLRTGMWTYEKMGGVDPQERHALWSPEELLINEPWVRRDGFAGAVVYPEFLTDDARLTLANARSAAGHGAVVLTYMSVEEVILERGIVCGVVLRDKTRDAPAVRVMARKIVNAAGPWVDAIRKLESAKAKEKLQLTKGIHIVLSKGRLPIHNTVVWSASDGRGVFAVPRGRFVYIGTTDTFYPEPVYWPEIASDDVAYLVDSANTIFSIDPITSNDILALWAGIRPLLGVKGKKPSEISRRNELFAGPGRMLTVAGGKLTSYRSMAERVADQCEKDFGRKPALSKTGDEPLPGGDFAESFEQLREALERMGLPALEAERAARHYGNEALTLFAGAYGPGVEAEFAVRNEGAVLLEDYWIRRSARIYFDDNNGLDALVPASKAMARLLGWNEDFRERQVTACRKKREEIMAVIER